MSMKVIVYELYSEYNKHECEGVLCMSYIQNIINMNVKCLGNYKV